MPGCSVSNCHCRCEKGHVSHRIKDEWKPILIENFGENGMKNWKIICECHFSKNQYEISKKLRTNALPCTESIEMSSKSCDCSSRKEV
jgi:hypothetical protein